MTTTDAAKATGTSSTAPKILAGGITVSMAIGLVGLVAARAAAEVNDQSAAERLAQEQATAEQQAGLAQLVAFKEEQDRLHAEQLAALKAEYQAQLDQLAAGYQAQLDAYTPPPVTTYVGSSGAAAGGSWSAPADSGNWSSPVSSGGSGWQEPAAAAPAYSAPASSAPAYSAPGPAYVAPAPAVQAPAAPAPAPVQAPAPAPAPVTSGS